MKPTVEERVRVNNELKKMGFGGLSDPHLFDQFAFFINSHKQFRGVLMSVKPSERKIAYESLAHRLSFKPKPLDVYEREVKELAEREQWDIWNGTAYPDKYKSGEVESEEYKLERQAQEAIEQNEHEKAKGILSLVCTKCTLEARFPAQTRKEAVKQSYDAGWRAEERNGSKKVYCPKHVPARCRMKLECAKENCAIVEILHVWDEPSGYEMARRLGWRIGDTAVCPRCSATHLIIQ